jgi:hypothetical protein
MLIHASLGDFSTCPEMGSPASSPQVLASQVPIAYSYQHSDQTHTKARSKLTNKMKNNENYPIIINQLHCELFIHYTVHVTITTHVRSFLCNVMFNLIF